MVQIVGVLRATNVLEQLLGDLLVKARLCERVPEKVRCYRVVGAFERQADTAHAVCRQDRVSDRVRAEREVEVFLQQIAQNSRTVSRCVNITNGCLSVVVRDNSTI